MKVRIKFARYYEYEVEGKDLDDCVENAEDLLASDSDYYGYDELDYKILEDNEEEEE
jgi:hypothetical protein